jgi:hypothetical protein
MVVVLSMNEALSQFATQQTIVNSLWAFYAVTCYGAGGFALPKDGRQRLGVAAAVSIGFSTFAVGHMFLLMHSLSLMTALQQVMEALTPKDDASAARLQSAVAQAAVYKYAIALPHLAIDAAVNIAIWAKVPAARHLVARLFAKRVPDEVPPG